MTVDSYPLRHTETYDVAKFFDYVRHELGYPVIEVELEESHAAQALTDALATYSRYKPRHVREAFLAGDGITKHRLKTVGARGVYHVEMVGINEGLQAPNVEAQLMSGSFAYYGVANPRFDLRYYEYLRQWVKVASRELSSEQDYHVETNPDRTVDVWIYSPGRDSKVTVELTMDHVSPETVPSHDQEWLRKYVLAKCKGVLGRIRSKFSSVIGANKDLSLDGASLLEESKSEIEKLEEDVKKARPFMAPTWG